MERLQAADRKENPTWWIGDSGLSGVLLFRHWGWIQILNTDGGGSIRHRRRALASLRLESRQVEAGLWWGPSS